MDGDGYIDRAEAQAAARTRIIADLNVFLNAVGFAALGPLADYNELDYTTDEHGETLHVYGPNGIPDWAEFAVIDTLVQDPSVDFTAYSGVGGEALKAAFNDNLDQAEIDLAAQEGRSGGRWRTI